MSVCDAVWFDGAACGVCVKESVVRMTTHERGVEERRTGHVTRPFRFLSLRQTRSFYVRAAR